MKKLYVRNIIFGIADSLTSTVGLLAGIAVSGSSRSAIILTGLVYAFVESFSMAVGSFLSEEGAEEFEAKTELDSTAPYIGATVMFVSFLFSSLVPILPYLFAPLSMALWLSILFALIMLFAVGLVLAKISNAHSVLRRGVKMMLLGGCAVIMGALIGKFVHL